MAAEALEDDDNIIFVQDGGVAAEELEDDEGVEQEQLDEESTDSMVSASPQLPSASSYQRPDSDSRSPYLIKRKSNAGSLFYQTRQASPPNSPTALTINSSSIGGIGGSRGGAVAAAAGANSGEGKLRQFVISILTVSPSNRLLMVLTVLLVCLLTSSVYLLLRLDQIQVNYHQFFYL